jgi:hypothetical protein
MEIKMAQIDLKKMNIDYSGLCDVGKNILEREIEYEVLAIGKLLEHAQDCNQCWQLVDRIKAYLKQFLKDNIGTLLLAIKGDIKK